MKLTTEEFNKLSKGPTNPKKVVKTRWKKCSYCEEEIKCATVTSLKIEGIFHPKCLKEIFLDKSCN